MFYVIFVEVNYIKRDTANKIDTEIGLLEEKNIKRFGFKQQTQNWQTLKLKVRGKVNFTSIQLVIFN